MDRRGLLVLSVACAVLGVAGCEGGGGGGSTPPPAAPVVVSPVDGAATNDATPVISGTAVAQGHFKKCRGRGKRGSRA